MSELTRRGDTCLLAAPGGATTGRGPWDAARRAAFLADVSRRLSGALQPDRAVDLLLEMLVDEIADWAQVTLRARRGHSCRSRLAAGTTRSALLPAAAVSPTGVLGRVLSRGARELVPVDEDAGAAGPTLESAVPAPDARAQLAAIHPVDVLTVPLSARGSTYGALTLARRAGEGFDEQAVCFITELAERASLGLDTIRALAEARRVAGVLSRDLNPPSLPRLPGVAFGTYYRVAFEQEALGGDFYDVHGDPDAWTAVVGDVCGKGADAAVLTGRVRQSVRTAALVDRSPARILDLVNRVLVAEEAETFVTAICARGRRDRDRLLLDLSAAGHPAPWLVRRDGSVEQVPTSGVVLGLVEDAGYADVTVALAPGDTLVLYTDGVLEAPGRRERFGDDRLRDVLRRAGAPEVSALVESVAVALAGHLGDRAHDDIAILAIQSGAPG